MRSRLLAFTSIVASLALASSLALYVGSAPLSSELRVAVLVLGSFAMIAELLAYLLPHGAHGSIAFIPYLACVLIAPSWASVAAIVLVDTIVQLNRRQSTGVAIFNIAQKALTLIVAIGAYQGLGGQSFLIAPMRNDFAALTRSMGLPAMGAYALSFATNTVVVSMFIAVRDGQSTMSVWRDLKLSTIGIDLLASPIVFLFAWLYAAHGAMAAAIIWVPMVGLRELHSTNIELERTNQELLELMVKSIEARDPYTSGHSRRVQQYSTTIARALTLPERDVARISRAALLHDVGKIHEKYGALLSKADRLTDDEWRVMQEHSADGAALVATMTRLRELVGAIRHHHENWDGSGYPAALAGDQIPIAARIIRFADTIDAMTTQRPYRAALSEDQVRQEIIRCRGTQFDPTITDKLLGSSLWKLLFATAVHIPTSWTSGRPDLTVMDGSKRTAS